MDEFVEGFIDEIDGANESLKTFVLPGGCELSSRLHMARCISRRCERCITELIQEMDNDLTPVRWINRASDLLFAMARAANRIHGMPDVPWIAES